MRKNLLSPQTLAEQPQLAILTTLWQVLGTSRLALLEAHGAIWDEESQAPYHGTGAEYSVALVHQIGALEGTLDGYFVSLERERIACWRSKESNHPNANF
jgi:hypothetical protein